MACTTCKGNCLCGQINISAIKGEKGDPGVDGTNGTDGLPNVLSIGTVTTGTAAATITGTSPAQVLNLTLPTATGTSTYFAWADDASGTGYTLTPSDKCFMAATDVLATPGSPIASDFTGLYFRINQPVLKYEKGQYLNMVQAVGAPYATPNLFSPAIPSFTVPFEFFESTESLLEFEVNTSIVYTGANVSNIRLYIQINGNQLELVDTPPGPFPSIVNSKIKLYRVNTTDIGVSCTSTIDNAGSSTTSYVKNYVTTLTAGSSITIKLSEYWSDIADANITVVSQSVKSFDPNKITC